jgi:hypothetical protein
VAGTCLAFAWNGRRLTGALRGPYVIEGHVAEAWARVGEEATSPVLRVSDGEAIIEIREEVIDPHPDEHRDPATGEPLDEYRLQAGTKVVALAKRLPDGSYGLPDEGPRLFASGSAADIAANARRAEAQMKRLAARVGAAGTAVLVLGIFLR